MVIEPKLAYRPAEAARLLGLSRETIFGLLKRGQLKGFRIGTARLIAASELSRYILERQEAEHGA